VTTPPKLTREQYLAFLGSPIGLSSFLTCLGGKGSWNLFLDFLDGKPALSAGALPFLRSSLLLVLNPFFLLSFFFLSFFFPSFSSLLQLHHTP